MSKVQGEHESGMLFVAEQMRQLPRAFCIRGPPFVFFTPLPRCLSPALSLLMLRPLCSSSRRRW